MLIAKNLLNALSDLDTNKCSNTNELDFINVLNFCSNNKNTGHILRCSDGKERVFNFEKGIIKYD